MTAHAKGSDKCWFKTCVNKAVMLVSIKGSNHRVCARHGKQYETSYEHEERS